jgi:hypothetical protein
LIADKKCVLRDYRKWVDDLAKKAEDAAQNPEKRNYIKLVPYYLTRWIKSHPVRDKKGGFLT